MPYGNPFYVQPAGDMSAGLSGLGATLRDIGEQRRQREEQEAQQKQLEDARAEIGAALKSGDMDQIQQVAVKYPSFANAIYGGMKITREDQKDRVLGHLREIVTADPTQIPRILQSRIEDIENRGGDATETKRELVMYVQNPEAMQKNFKMAYAAIAPAAEYGAYKQSLVPVEPVTYADKSGTVLGQAVPGSPEAQALEAKGGIQVKAPSLGDLRPKADTSQPAVYADTKGNILGTAIPGSPEANQFIQKGGFPIKSPSLQDLQGGWGGMSGSSDGSASADTLHGDEYLKTLDPAIASQLKNAAEGRMQPPSSFALSKPYWQHFIKMLNQYDPSVDATNWSTRVATRKDFTSGQTSKNLTNINQLIGHMDTFKKAVDDLDNGNYPSINRMYNFLAPELGGTETAAKLKKFNTAKDAVANELMRVFRGTGAATADIREWAKNFDAADSTPALHSAIDQALDLLNSRIDALDQQYKRGMGTHADVLNLLNPKSVKILKELEGEAAPNAQGETDSSADSGWTTLPNGVKIRVKQ